LCVEIFEPKALGAKNYFFPFGIFLRKHVKRPFLVRIWARKSRHVLELDVGQLFCSQHLAVARQVFLFFALENE